MEETLIILKPDCMEKRIAGEVITRFENAGFDIVASKVTQLMAQSCVSTMPTWRICRSSLKSKPS